MAARRFSLEPREVPRVETRYRRIRTPLPVPESLPLLTNINEYEPDAMTGMAPVVWDCADACSVFDPYGNMWLDWTSGVLAAVHFVRPGIREPDPGLAFRIVESCVLQGLMLFAPVGWGGASIKICPPLIIEEDAAKEGAELLARVIDNEKESGVSAEHPQ